MGGDADKELIDAHGEEDEYAARGFWFDRLVRLLDAQSMVATARANQSGR